LPPVVKVHLKGIHRVRKRLADGSRAEYHYAWRGGPRIWTRDSPYRIGSIDYMQAFQAATTTRPQVQGTFREIIEEFLSSKEFEKLGDRTKADHKKNISAPDGIEAEFGKAPIAAMEHPRIRVEIIRWRDKFSPGTGDNRMSTMQRIISFAFDRGLLAEHRLLRISKRTKSNRADIIWKQDEIDAFVAGAPAYVGRILLAAVETGYRPGDLLRIGPGDVERNKNNRDRIVIKTRKSNGRNFAAVPVTPKMAELIAATPAGQATFIVNKDGTLFKTANSLGAVIHDWRDKLGLRKELHLYDARGTAVTRLVRAGCTIAELAAHMGWSVAHAADMVSRYAALDPDMTDGIQDKVEGRKRDK
jgi:integrase